MNNIILATLAAASVLACSGGADRDVAPLVLSAPLEDVTLVREASGSARGGADLYLPSRPTVVGTDVWVLDEGNDRLVRFDSMLSNARVYGRPGQAPGELEFAQDLALDGDRLIVAETGNGRISTFDTTGAFRSTLPLPRPPRHVAVTRAGLAITLVQPEAYAYRVDSAGALMPWASVPDPLARLGRSDAALYPRAAAFVAPSPGGGLSVIDPSVVALIVFDARGVVVSARLLPEPFRSALLQRRSAQTEAWGTRAASFVDRPATKRLSATDDGSLLLLFPLERHWGLLIDPRAGTAHPLALPADPRTRDILWSASDARLEGERLFVTSGSQLYELHLERGGTDAPAASLTSGPANAPHRLLVFTDYQCAACALLERAAGPELRALAATGSVRVEVRHFPLVGHRRAGPAAAAALCAERQGAGWRMHEALFGTASAWTGSAPSKPWFVHLADSLGLDAPVLARCTESGEIAGLLAADLATGTMTGLIGVPAVFLDGRLVAFRSPADLVRRVARATSEPVPVDAVAQRVP